MLTVSPPVDSVCEGTKQYPKEGTKLAVRSGRGDEKNVGYISQDGNSHSAPLQRSAVRAVQLIALSCKYSDRTDNQTLKINS
jgi:hypothetical protein